MFKIFALVVAVCTAQFFDCEKQLERAKNDEQATFIIRNAVESGQKLSSACLEHVLLRNLF